MTEFATTVVVPLYGDLPSAERCIRSVLEHVDLERNRLLLVNDVGPEADAMEALALRLIQGASGARYVRNDRNLGFVGTCNRAAYELDTSGNDILLLNSDAMLFPGTLDEMTAVLHLSEKHGVVTARSNYATIATLPARTASGRPPTLERSLEVFAAVKDSLPRYSVVPVAHGFCFLARRTLISNHGLFDPAFAPGYGEENDFCLRVNARGFSSVMANRAFASHEGEKSFSSLAQQAIKAEHEQLLIDRYPFYPSALVHYDQAGIDAVDWFADLLVPADRDAKVLIDLHHMSLIYDGTVRNALTFLAFLRAEHQAGRLEGLELTIVSSPEAIDFFDLRSFGFTVKDNAELEELFDVGFALAPLSAPGQLRRFDRLCVRWVASHLDIIAVRITALWETEYSRAQVVVDSLRYADRVVAISQATVDDTIDRFPALHGPLSERSIVVHQGVARESLTAPSESLSHHSQLSPAQTAAIESGSYALIVGNTFLHKQVVEAVAALGGKDYTVVCFGGSIETDAPNVIPVRGGYLTDADLSRLYESAGVIVYPSAYEGFGLPIAEAALHSKRLVLFDTAVAREVAHGLDIDQQVTYFSDFRDLDAVVTEALARSAGELRPAPHIRTIDEYNSAVLDVIRDVLAEEPDADRLRSRRQYFTAVGAYEAGQLQRTFVLERELSRRPLRLASAAAHRLRFARPVVAAVWRRLPLTWRQRGL